MTPTFTHTAGYQQSPVDTSQLTIGSLTKCPICDRPKRMPGADYCPDCVAMQRLYVAYGPEMDRLYEAWKASGPQAEPSTALAAEADFRAFESRDELMQAYFAWFRGRSSDHWLRPITDDPEPDPPASVPVAAPLAPQQSISLEAVQAIVANVAAAYPSDIWPDDSRHPESMAARGARLACRLILEDVQTYMQDLVAKGEVADD